MININRITMESYWKEKINIIVIIKNNRLYINFLYWSYFTYIHMNDDKCFNYTSN